MSATAWNPAHELASLCWDADSLVTNPFGERVWLKSLYENGRRIGITDCCHEDDPCTYHRRRFRRIYEEPTEP